MSHGGKGPWIIAQMLEVTSLVWRGEFNYITALLMAWPGLETLPRVLKSKRCVTVNHRKYY